MRKLMLLWCLLPLVTWAQESKSFMLDMTEITVKQGHESAFLAGVEAWKDCYLENNGEDHWNFWRRMQGEGSVYTITGRLDNWAELDDMGKDTAGKECYSVVKDMIMPHVLNFNNSMARFLPDWSFGSSLEDMGLVWVTFFEIKNSTYFKEMVSGIGEALKESENERRGFWYAMIGGDRDGADYFVSTPFTKFADLDKDDDGVWEVYEKKHGKKKTDEMRNKFRESIVDVWSYLYVLNKDLSN